MQAELCEYDLRLIFDALNVLQENREREIKWAGGDPYLVEYNRKEIDEIDDLLYRLSGEQPDNSRLIGVPEPHVVTFCGSDGEPVSSFEDGYECPYCHATGVRHYCPDCGAKMFYTE